MDEINERPHMRRQDDKHFARGRTAYRIRRGDVQRLPCEICGAEPAKAHHIDYNDPDRVMWLCEPHHHQTHSQFGKPAPLDWQSDIRAALERIDAQRLELRRRAARSTDEDQAALDS
jgi:hypothetical protein